MDIRDVLKIPTMDEFYKVRDSLNLTDRQREIFYLKFSRGWRNIDIAEELGINQDTVGDETKILREKLAAINIEEFNKKNGEIFNG